MFLPNSTVLYKHYQLSRFKSSPSRSRILLFAARLFLYDSHSNGNPANKSMDYLLVVAKHSLNSAILCNFQLPLNLNLKDDNAVLNWIGIFHTHDAKQVQNFEDWTIKKFSWSTNHNMKRSFTQHCSITVLSNNWIWEVIHQCIKHKKANPF